MDGYFTVTGHWVEEQAPGKWKLEHALLGFTLMNTAHNGVYLGQALYKICSCLNTVYKVHSHSLFECYISLHSTTTTPPTSLTPPTLTPTCTSFTSTTFSYLQIHPMFSSPALTVLCHLFLYFLITTPCLTFFLVL